MRYIGQLWNQSRGPAERQALRVQATDFVRTRGTAQIPPPPREITVQSAPRGLYLTWNLPDPRDPGTSYIVGWRVYKDDENTLYEEIRDRGNRQKFVESTAGSAPPVTNVFISSINALGQESQKVQVQGSALTEAGAPTFPGAPPGYTGTGGKNTSTRQGQMQGL